MRRKRGQASVEYIILIAFLLVFFVPITHYSLEETNNAIKMSQINSFIERVSKSIDAIHAIGPGALKVISVSLPHGVESSELVNEGDFHEIVVRISYAQGISDVHATVKPTIGGEFPNRTGSYFLKIKCINDTFVNISIS